MTREEILLAERSRLFALSYRMLGQSAEAEDAIQEASLRFLRAEPAPDNPGAWLTQVATRLCIDRLRQLKRRREAYHGPWVPEPLAPQVQDPAELADSLSVAFLVLLERLSPAERAVFLLRKVFDCGYAEIAEVIGKSEAACRQLFHRGEGRLASARRRFHVEPGEGERLRSAFLTACLQGDLDGLRAVLHDDAVLLSDGGGKVAAAGKPLHGSLLIARFVLGILRHQPSDARIEAQTLNGMPALVVWSAGQLITVLCIDVRDARIAGLYALRNPEKLVGLQAALSEPD